MPDSAAAVKIKIGNIEVPEALVRRNPQGVTRQAQQTSAVTVPTSNPLYKIMFSEDIEPEEKRKQIAKYVTFVGTKQETREHNKAREEFEDYLEAERKRMQEELLKLTDTDTFAVLQGVINDMNTDLLDFEQQMKPLTDILDAIYTLQTEGKAIDAFREIQTDKKDEATKKAEREQFEATFGQLRTTMRALTTDIASLGEEKSWFGFGGVKETARKQIAEKNLKLSESQANLADLQAKLEALSTAPPETNLAEFANEKQQLRNLLDISGPQHSAQVRALVDGALKFVKTSSDRVGEVREHFSRMGDQWEHLKDANGKMTAVRSVLAESISDAKQDTLGQHNSLAVVPDDENMIRKQMREEKLEAVDDHVKVLDSAIRTNTVSLTELTGEAITIRTARDEHSQMLDKTRILHTQGIAGVASRLNTTINALSMAALNESSKIAGQTLRRMIEDTNEITQKEVVRSAMGVQTMTDDVQTVLSDLSSLGETLRASSTIYRSGLSELHDIIGKAREITDTVRGDIQEAAAIHADAANGADTDTPKAKLNGSMPPPQGNRQQAASPFGA
jgi:hypothetical protein